MDVIVLTVVGMETLVDDEGRMVEGVVDKDDASVVQSSGAVQLTSVENVGKEDRVLINGVIGRECQVGGIPSSDIDLSVVMRNFNFEGVGYSRERNGVSVMDFGVRSDASLNMTASEESSLDWVQDVVVSRCNPKRDI